MTTTLSRPPDDLAPVQDAADRHRLTAPTGIAALGLDALASTAYGPEAIVLALAVADAAGIGFTLPVTLAIVGLLVVLVICYRQVIRAYPDGGGAYTVATHNLGPRAGRIAAASLVVDYVLNVAVSVAAGVAALTSAFPALLPWTVEVGLAVLALVTVVNLRGVATGGRVFAIPAALFVLAVGAVIVAGLLRGEPLSPMPAPSQPEITESVGVLLILAAFANGCAALTGIEAIANATPSFRAPRAKRARRAEAALGAVLGILLIGLAALVERFDARPTDGRTLLSLLTEGALGTGFGYVAVQLLTVVLLALAANTSYGGLPVLLARLSSDSLLPHIFGLRADRQVYRQGILALSVVAGVLLVFSGGQVTTLVPLFAIGVFVGFTLSQAGMVRHWLREKGRGWQARLALAAIGATLTAAAALVITAEKFFDGAWLIVLIIPLLVLGFSAVHRGYDRIGEKIGTNTLPERPQRAGSAVIVPVTGMSRLTSECLTTALSMGRDVVAVHVTFPDELDEAREILRKWHAWRPEVPLVCWNPGAGSSARASSTTCSPATKSASSCSSANSDPTPGGNGFSRITAARSSPDPSTATPMRPSAASTSNSPREPGQPPETALR
ncbi:APC family permease [Saccharopolyspora elongata]|uniref:APC family permease n=1 Tax=Saccharopolyspora elongata TaxID=2530387 RepID=UPI001F30140A|nr:APC family permease [Saccharopolyspora elongata]